MEIWWDFGDGTQSFHPNPVKRYHSPGVYTVTLFGRATGAVGRATTTIFVTGNPPKPRITSPAATNGIYEFDYSETLTFRASVTGGTTPLTYKWTVNLVHLNRKSQLILCCRVVNNNHCQISTRINTFRIFKHLLYLSQRLVVTLILLVLGNYCYGINPRNILIDS